MTWDSLALGRRLELNTLYRGGLGYWDHSLYSFRFPACCSQFSVYNKNISDAMNSLWTIIENTM